MNTRIRSLPMPPEEFIVLRAILDVSQVRMAELLGVGDERTIRGYEKGEHLIPGPARVLTRMLVELKLPFYTPGKPVG
ncbi:MAG: hypothetical protein OSB57_11440 [Planctomycetota bacterium]|nr:hypothetical protein [Planctomycetota bacterium]